MAAPTIEPGVYVGDWTVIAKAPAQNRVRFWTCEHGNCCTVTDLPHTMLRDFLMGKLTSLPPCLDCTPEEETPNVSHGMHLDCGKAHLIGTECPTGITTANAPAGAVVGQTSDGTPIVSGGSFLDPPTGVGPGQCKHAVMVQDCEVCAPLMGDAPPMVPPVPPVVTGEPVTQFVAGGGTIMRPAGSKSWDLGELESVTSWDLEAIVERAEEAAWWANNEPSDNDLRMADVDTTTGAATVFGRVDRLDEPQRFLDVIRDGLRNDRRSAQWALGPSEIGGCERKQFDRIVNGKVEEPDVDQKFRPWMGTQGHSGLEALFGRVAGLLSEHPVGAPVPGTVDLFEIATGTSIDFKFGGTTTRKKAEKGVVSMKYEVQGDVYGLGLEAQGFKPKTVALLFLPPGGSLRESVWYSRPWNRDRGLEYVQRHQKLERLAESVRGNPDTFGEVAARLSITEDWCSSCVLLGKHCAGETPKRESALKLVRS